MQHVTRRACRRENEMFARPHIPRKAARDNEALCALCSGLCLRKVFPSFQLSFALFVPQPLFQGEKRPPPVRATHRCRQLYVDDDCRARYGAEALLLPRKRQK